MADDEHHGRTINEELQMMGEAGDDEDDLNADREELLGGSSATPIELAGDDNGNEGADVDGVLTGSCKGSTKKRGRASSSEVWKDFEKIFKIVDGRKIRWQAKCIHCKVVYSGVYWRSTFDVFIHTHYPRKADDPPLLSDNHWYVAEKILVFLQLFYDSTVALSGVYYLTSPLILHHLIRISGHLKQYENDRLLREVVVPMKSKYLKYWRDIPLLYAIAFILDPRAKLRVFHKVLLLLSSNTGVDYSAYLTVVRAELTTMYNQYNEKFGAVIMQKPLQPANSGKQKSAWDEIFSEIPASESGSCGTDFSSSHPTLSRRTSASALLQAASTSAAGIGSELTAYLDSGNVNQYTDDFNIQHWWHEHRLTYPVLSLMAKDVLSVPVSTISSEAAFSLTGRILEDRRRRLNPEMVEMLSCIKDWEAGQARSQHMVEGKELEITFASLCLDDQK